MIEKNLLRLIIPFQVGKPVDKSRLFETGWKMETLVKGECDLYDYIQRLISTSDEDSSIGSSWMLDINYFKKITGKKNSFIAKLNNDKRIAWNIKKIGIVFFVSGASFLWLELRFKTTVDEQEYLYLINGLKELAYSNERQTIAIIEENGKYTDDNKAIRLYDDIVYPIISQFDLVSFYANRGNNETLKPDKAVIFSWIHSDSDDETDRKTVLFRLSHGYTDKYRPTEMFINSDKEICQPFIDSYWCMYQEGCANLTFDDNSFYVGGGYAERLNTYFFLYILSLSQYYGLLINAQNLSRLPSNIEDYEKEEIYMKIRNYLAMENLFFLKNIYNQVSHVSHQNEVYAYMQDRLNIAELYRELSDELAAMHRLLEEKHKEQQKIREKKEELRQKRMANRLSFITVAGAIFVIVDLISNAFSIAESSGIGLLAVLLAITLCAVIAFILIHIYQIMQERTEEEENR